MQGMRIKSHKGYFANVKNNRYQFQTPWIGQMVQPAAPPKVVSIQVKTAATAKKKATKAAAPSARKAVAKRAATKRR